jgi:dTMP kinase
MSSPPVFVVLEGVDRCGKSRQAEILVSRLVALGHPARAVSTPDYSTAVGEIIRRHLAGDVYLADASGSQSRFDPLAFECVQIVDKYATSARVRRTLDDGTSVASARWWQSALVYGRDDGVDSGLILDAVERLVRPDLSLLIDVDPATIARRCDHHNRYERDLAKQQRLAARYRELWRDEKRIAVGRGWCVISGDGTEDEVAARVWQAIVAARPDLAVRI